MFLQKLNNQNMQCVVFLFVYKVLSFVDFTLLSSCHKFGFSFTQKNSRIKKQIDYADFGATIILPLLEVAPWDVPLYVPFGGNVLL